MLISRERIALNNKVIAFEASPRNIFPLRENVINNHFESRVDIYDVAVGKTQGELAFSFMSDEQTGWGGLSVNQNESNTINVSVVTLDSFFKDRGLVIDCLKIDTEGADTWVLEGASQLLKERRIKHIFFEENLVRMSALGIKQNKAKDLLLSYGYVVKPINQGEYYATLVDIHK